MEVNGVRYGKPNMAALEGEWGRKIFDEIVTSPRLDRKKLQQESDKVTRRILEAQANGTY